MPTTKKESFIFTMMMCSFMVLFMSMYNVARIHGINEQFTMNVLKGLPLGILVAFIADWFLVGNIAKKIAFTIIKENDPIHKKAIIISTFMVMGMVLVMSLFGAVVGVGLSSMTLRVWMINIPLNLIVALPLQLLIAGPLVRLGFGKIFRKQMQ